MNLSENFTLSELTVTNSGFPNNPDIKAKEKLLYLANYILQPIRNRWGAVKVTSGYRSAEVNQAIGGVETSQHRLGEAADIIPSADIKDVYRWIVEDSGLVYGQCILEKNTWIHISLIRFNKSNHDALIYDGSKYTRYNGVL